MSLGEYVEKGLEGCLNRRGNSRFRCFRILPLSKVVEIQKGSYIIIPILSSRCKACDTELLKLGALPVLPTWASLWAYDNVTWSEFAPASTDKLLWPSVTPILNDTYFIRVQQPFLSSDRNFRPWILFQPPSSALNGWDDAPDEIPPSSFVRVKLLDVFSAAKDFAWLKVHVLEILPLAQVVTTFDPHPPPETSPLDLLLSEPSSRKTSAVSGDFAYISYCGEGDLGEWIVCQKWQSRWRLIIMGEWSFHFDFIYVGQRLLNEKELRAFNLI